MYETLRAQEKLRIIDQMPLFSGLSLRDKRLIANSSVLVEYKRGEIVYREGAPPDALYSIVSGRLKAYVARQEKKEDLEYLKRGKYFGIISLLTGEPHSVAVQAINDSIILKIPKDDFGIILKRIPQLAIHLSQGLSRRLKRKDIHEKRIFESTIIAVFGTSGNVGATNYAVNLAVSLKVQTAKRIVLLDISRTGEDVSRPLGIEAELRPIHLDSPFFDEGTVKASIFRHALGIDVMKIPHRPDETEETTQVIPLVSYLTNDYHYVIIDLPSYMDKTTFESLKQSDVIHIVTASDEASLRSTRNLLTELEKPSSNIGQKVRVITSEYGLEKPPGFAQKQVLLEHDIFATLPDMDKSGLKIDARRVPIVTEYPDCEYAKAVRRISRQTGDCLIGLALGSGAAFSLAHIGVLKIIEREKIPIDVVIGTSMGALIGALWASGRDAAKIEEIVRTFKRKVKTFGLIDLTFPKVGLIKGREVKRLLRSQFGDMTFYDLKLPFKVVACDIEKREEVILDKGSLVDALMASIAIPGIFEPVRLYGLLLVDGGIVNPLATNVLMKMGVAKIIAVNTLPSPADIEITNKRVSNIFDVIVNSMHASEYLLAEVNSQNADIVIRPILPTIRWYEFYEGQKIIKKGEEEAMKYLSQLKELAMVL